jgi:hypothetical protein
MKKYAILSFWIFLMISCEKENPPSGFGELEGYTYLNNENNPVKGLEILIPDNNLAFTDSKGYFKFPKIAEGNHPLKVLYQMDPIYSTTVDVYSDKITTLKITLQRVKKELPDFSVVNISPESEWDYWVVGKEEYFYIDEENSLPKSVFFHSSKNGKEKEYVIFFDAQGLPRKVITDHYIFLFDNFNGNKVDLGILSPEGEIQIVREIQTDFVWPTSSKGTQSRADVIRWTGRIIAAIPCITSGAAAFITGGAAIPLALWTCGNYFLSMANNFFDDADVENGFTEFVDRYHLAGTIYTCADPNISSCLVIFAQEGLDSYADYIEEMDEREELIRTVEASLGAGYGDVQVTLTWDNESDLDLHVIDPLGEEIFWLYPGSTSGGILDYDDVDGYGPENVYWPKSQAPSGTYQVFVYDYFWENKPQSAKYVVLITAFGKIKKFTGTIAFYETVHIINFNEKEIKSAKSADLIQRINVKSKKSEINQFY